MLVVILAGYITEQRTTNNQTKQAYTSFKTKINLNKSKPHLEKPDYLLIFYPWQNIKL